MTRGVWMVLVTCACRGALASGQPGLSRDPSKIARLAAHNTSFSLFSGFADSTRFVVRDSGAWRATWQTLQRPFIPAPPMPTIDFSREMVLVAALGTRPSEGYDIVFENVREDSAGIEVAVRVSEPAPGCPVAAARTQPVDVARMPASVRPVRFRQRNVVVPCGVR
jgi:hypothetical protein